jgi:stage IV sporulation protein A
MNMVKLHDAEATIAKIGKADNIQRAFIKEIKAGSGTVLAEAELPRQLFYSTLSERSGFAVNDDGDLLKLLTDMSGIKSELRVKDALKDVREKGYGIVYPAMEELKLCEPEIVRHGGRYGVRLKASAPSIHMILANIETEVSPALGSEKHSEDIINYLLQEFEGNAGKIWESNIFGKSLYDIAGEGLQTKIKKMPEDAQGKLQETLQRIVNEGSAGLICILL